MLLSAERSDRQHHISLLYEASQVVLRFDGMGSLPPIWEIVRRALSLRTVVLIELLEDGPRTNTWAYEDATEEDVAAAERHALASLCLFTDREGAPREAPVGAALRRYVTLPLVAGGQPPFGALQFESAQELEVEDLTFASTLANQLAVALAKHRSFEREIGLRKRAEAAEKRTREVLAIVSHDIANPLNVMLLGLRLLAERVEQEELHHHLHTVTRAAERISRLVLDLLDSSAIEAGKVTLATTTPKRSCGRRPPSSPRRRGGDRCSCSSVRACRSRRCTRTAIGCTRSSRI
jgi:signal transduction histidine kinase